MRGGLPWPPIPGQRRKVCPHPALRATAPLLALRATSPVSGESVPKGGRLLVEVHHGRKISHHHQGHDGAARRHRHRGADDARLTGTQGWRLLYCIQRDRGHRLRGLHDNGKSGRRRAQSLDAAVRQADESARHREGHPPPLPLRDGVRCHQPGRVR